MAKQVQMRRGTTAEHASFAGAVGEVTVDTDKKTAVVHDSSTAGGFPLARPGLAQTFTAEQTFTNTVKLQQALEKWHIVADNIAVGDNNIDVLTAAIWDFTTAGDTNAGLNIRGDGSNSLNSLMSVGQSITIAVVLIHTGTAYYINSFKIDGSSVTPKWVDGAAVAAGSVNAEDVYSFTITKTANATFKVKAQRVKFA